MKKILIYLLGALVLFALLIPQGLNASPPSGPPYSNSAQGPGPASILTTIHVGVQPKGVAVDEGDNYVFISLYGENRIARVNENLNHEVDYGYAGDGPNQIAFNPTNQRVYVTNRNSNNVTILDASTLVAPMAPVSVGKLPWGIATDPLTKEVYVANFGSGRLSVLNGDSGSLITAMILPPNAQNPAEQPSLAAFDSASGYLYFTGWQTGNLYVMDRAKSISNILYAAQGAFEIAASPGGQRVFVTNRLMGLLFAMDCYGASKVGCYSEKWFQLPSAYGVAYNPHTDHIFVVGETSSGEVLYVIDGQTYQTIQTLSLGTANQGEGGQGIALNHNTDRVYVTNYAEGTLSVIQDAPQATPAPTNTPTVTNTPTATSTPTNTPTVTNTPTATDTPTVTNTPTSTPTFTDTPLLTPTPTLTYPPVFGPYVLTTVPVGIHPKSAAIENLRSREIFTALFDSSQLRILDESNYQFYGSVGTGGLHPNQVVRGAPFTFDITNRDSNSLTVLDWRVPGPACTSPTGNLPWGVAYNPTNHRIYVANYGLPKESGSISVFDEQCNRVKTIPLPGDRPALMTEMNGYVYAAGWGTGNLYIIDANNVVTNPINVGPGAFGLAANPAIGRIYLTNRLTGRFYIILAGGGNANISIAVTLPSPGYAVAANPNLGHTFVVSAVSDQVFALDGYYGGLIYPLPVGHQDADEGGQGIVVNTASNRIYVTNYADGTMTVIQDIVTYPQPPPPCLPNCNVPTLASLPNGAKTKQKAVALDWTDTPSITRYEIVVKQGSTTGPTVASSKALTVSKFTTKPLTPGKAYFWRVRACTAKACSAWTKWWKFVVTQ